MQITSGGALRFDGVRTQLENKLREKRSFMKGPWASVEWPKGPSWPGDQLELETLISPPVISSIHLPSQDFYDFGFDCLQMSRLSAYEHISDAKSGILHFL